MKINLLVSWPGSLWVGVGVRRPGQLFVHRAQNSHFFSSTKSENLMKNILTAQKRVGGACRAQEIFTHAYPVEIHQHQKPEFLACGHMPTPAIQAVLLRFPPSVCLDLFELLLKKMEMKILWKLNQ